MIAFNERKISQAVKQLSISYSRLHLLFLEVAEAIVGWQLIREGILPEAEKSNVERARYALSETDKTLTQLKQTENDIKFDDRELEKQYRSDLNICSVSLKGMAGALNGIWKHGNPSEREVPFGDATNYKFIIDRLITYMNWANVLSQKLIRE